MLFMLITREFLSFVLLFVAHHLRAGREREGRREGEKEGERGRGEKRATFMFLFGKLMFIDREWAIDRESFKKCE